MKGHGKKVASPHGALLEIGVEELPARFLNAALHQLQEKATAAAQQIGLPVESVRALGTPRRLGLLWSGVATRTEDRVQEFLGPPLSQAKDSQGAWTRAALGFAASHGQPPEQLAVRATDRGERLCFVRHTPGMAAEKALVEVFGQAIRQLAFPKSMVWEASRFGFARPIRWLVALYGAKVLRLEVAGVKAGRKSRGLRSRGKSRVDIPSPERYEDVLLNHLILADTARRRRRTEHQVHQAARQAKGEVNLETDGALLEEVTNLIEHPVGILGQYEERFLELPAEVLITSMKKHQKFFPVFSTDGRLLPHFVGVRNGMSEHQAVVREGYERVLSARLADAAFFYDKDRKLSLEERLEALRDVGYLRQDERHVLTMMDKVVRVQKLVEWLCDTLPITGSERDHALRAAWLCKADLTTSMVGEFPELQGVMGRIYALHAAGQPEERAVAKAIERHYWPLSADGALPTDAVSSLVAVADKMDTLVGNYLVGKTPKGSADPYGLRRAAIGMLRIISAQGWRVSLAAFIERALSENPFWGQDHKDRQLPQKLQKFLRQRWEALKSASGERFDEIEAVAVVRFDDIVDTERRLVALKEIRRHPDFTPLAAAFKRADNILSQARKKNLTWPEQASAALCQEEVERALAAQQERLQTAVEPLVGRGEYAAALRELVALKAPVDAFFEQVMVMTPETEVRNNRLALLGSVTGLFRRVADLACLQDVPDGN